MTNKIFLAGEFVTALTIYQRKTRDNIEAVAWNLVGITDDINVAISTCAHPAYFVAMLDLNDMADEDDIDNFEFQFYPLCEPLPDWAKAHGATVELYVEDKTGEE